MIFVSYSHADEKWRKRFETISKPLARSEEIQFWSDRNIGAGQWETQIEKAMADAIAAVLLVSDNFLASDYIINKELPYLMRAYDKRGLMIFWALLEPCDYKRFTEITRFQAMSTGNLEPMSKMTDWQWKETMVHGCGMIDEYLMKLECPNINRTVAGKPFSRLVERFPLLVKPSRRDIEVLVYGGGKWWRQARIKAGGTTTRIHLGNDQTKNGTEFPIVAMTCSKPLTNQTYPNLPEHRTQAEVIVQR
jgi:hypothetical protein